MGGRLYKDGRMPRAPYEAVQARLTPLLNEALGAGNWRVPLVHSDKQDFGDLDILVLSSAMTPERIAAVARAIGALEQRSVDAVISLRVPTSEQERAQWPEAPTALQVDLFAAGDAQGLQDHFNFMSWGDLGNILGRMVRRWDLLWGEDGLEYVLRRESHFKRRVRIGGLEMALELVGLSLGRYQRGFAREADMFEWLMSAPNFDPRPYLDPSRAAHKRAKDRPGMMRFIQAVDAAYGPFRPEVHGTEPREARERDVYPLVRELDGLRSAPHGGARLLSWYADIEQEWNEIQESRRRFSGTTISAVRPELSGSGLGNYLRRFREAHAVPSLPGPPSDSAASKEDGALEASFRHWVLQRSDTEIKIAVLRFEPNNQELELSEAHMKFLHGGEMKRRAGIKAAREARRAALAGGLSRDEAERAAERAQEEAIAAFETGKSEAGKSEAGKSATP